MYKSFTAALLATAAFGRGDNNGLGQQNAITSELVVDGGNKVVLHHYNSDNAGVYEFHGDVSATLAATGQFLRYGFCIRIADDKWDCLDATAGLDPKQIASDDIYKSDFTITDSYVDGATIGAFPVLKKDTEFAIEDAAKNFMVIGDKSYKNCTEKVAVPNSNPVTYYVDCSDANVHFYRNFETNAKVQDGQLSLDIADVELDIVGYMMTATTADFKSGMKMKTGPVLKAKPVTAAFKAAVEAKGTDGGSDGATAMTTMALALSAVAALF